MFGYVIVRVYRQNAQRQGTYFRKQLPVSNSGLPVWANVDIEVTLLGAGVDGGNIVTTRNGHRFMAPSPETLSYDDDGNLVSDGRWLYSWDGENRLITMQSQASAVAAGVPKRKLEFAYDGGSRRIHKQVYDWDDGTSSWTLNSERRFVYDQWNLVAEVDASGDLIKSHVWGMDLSQTMQGAGGVGGLLWSTDHEKGHTHFHTYDGNGNVTAMVNASTAAVEARYDYNAFGETVMVEGGEIAEGNTFRFSTKYQDAETGLYYYGFRYYQPTTGRWLNRDPIEERGGVNLYGMVGNDAVNKWDFLGLRDFANPNNPNLDYPSPDPGIRPDYYDEIAARRRNPYWEYLTLEEQQRAISNVSVINPPAKSKTPDERIYKPERYGCCDGKTIADGKKNLQRMAKNVKRGSVYLGENPSCHNCSMRLLGDMMKCSPCWSCYAENRRWKKSGVKDHWVVICFAVNQSGQVADRVLFDNFYNVKDVVSYRNTWDLLWEFTVAPAPASCQQNASE